MKIFERITALLKARDTKPSDVAQSCHMEGTKGIHIFDHVIEISKLDFVGRYSKSRNGQWIVGWGDADRYVLYSNESRQIVVTGTLETPNNGAVANNGTFLIESSRHGGDLNGTLCIFGSDGQVIVKRSFAAILFNSALSSDGAWAICQTCNNPKHDDGNRLTAFDLTYPTELFSVHPETGWADEYGFSDDGSRFFVFQNELGRFAYDRAGRFLDSHLYEEARFQSGRFEIVLSAVEDLLRRDDLTIETANKALDAVNRARKLGADEHSDWRATALKQQGLAYECLGHLEQALASFDEALRLNPKIGVKRKAAILRKRISK